MKKQLQQTVVAHNLPRPALSGQAQPRAASRRIFNLGVGSDNLFRRERLRTMLRVE